MYGHRNNEMLARSVSGSRLLFREPIKRCAPPLCRKDSRILIRFQEFCFELTILWILVQTKILLEVQVQKN